MFSWSMRSRNQNTTRCSVARSSLAMMSLPCIQILLAPYEGKLMTKNNYKVLKIDQPYIFIVYFISS